MTSPKKIGLFTCIAVVAGNMMGSGIALLPAGLARIGAISIIGWIIATIGALALAYVFARLSTKNPQEGGPVAYAGEISPLLGYQTSIMYIITPIGLAILLLPSQRLLILQCFSPFLISQFLRQLQLLL
ncbi:TPA: amino acid permease [Haemophilus influenzae]